MPDHHFHRMNRENEEPDALSGPGHERPREAFDGEIVAMQTFGEAGFGQDPDLKEKITHAEFKAGGIQFMASDRRPSLPPATGNNVWLNVNLHDRTEQDRIWAVLIEGGEVTQPLNDTFWGHAMARSWTGSASTGRSTASSLWPLRE
jgi:PhnB protein